MRVVHGACQRLTPIYTNDSSPKSEINFVYHGGWGAAGQPGTVSLRDPIAHIRLIYNLPQQTIRKEGDEEAEQ